MAACDWLYQKGVHNLTAKRSSLMAEWSALTQLEQASYHLFIAIVAALTRVYDIHIPEST